MSPSIDNEKLINFLRGLNHHSLLAPNVVAERLRECGLEVMELVEGRGVVVEGRVIGVTKGDWGEGIFTLDILSTVCLLTIRFVPESHMTGRGFWYRDVLGKFEKELIAK